LPPARRNGNNETSEAEEANIPDHVKKMMQEKEKRSDNSSEQGNDAN
jgi:hypothetical protein